MLEHQQTRCDSFQNIYCACIAKVFGSPQLIMTLCSRLVVIKEVVCLIGSNIVPKNLLAENGFL